MKKENKIQLFCYILIIVLMILGGKVDQYAIKQARFNFAMNYYFIKLLLQHVVFIIIGLLIGYVHLYKEKQKQGRWKVEGLKIAVVSVLPTFYLLRSIMFLLAYVLQINAPFLIFTILSNVFLIGHTQFENAMMLIWGFSVITSFSKTDLTTDTKEVES